MSFIIALVGNIFAYVYSRFIHLSSAHCTNPLHFLWSFVFVHFQPFTYDMFVAKLAKGNVLESIAFTHGIRPVQAI